MDKTEPGEFQWRFLELLLVTVFWVSLSYWIYFDLLGRVLSRIFFRDYLYPAYFLLKLIFGLGLFIFFLPRIAKQNIYKKILFFILIGYLSGLLSYLLACIFFTESGVEGFKNLLQFSVADGLIGLFIFMPFVLGEWVLILVLGFFWLVARKLPFHFSFQKLQG